MKPGFFCEQEGFMEDKREGAEGMDFVQVGEPEFGRISYLCRIEKDWS